MINGTYYEPTEIAQLLEQKDNEIRDLNATIGRIWWGTTVVNNNLEFVQKDLRRTKRILGIVGIVLILENIIIIFLSRKKKNENKPEIQAEV